MASEIRSKYFGNAALPITLNAGTVGGLNTGEMRQSDVVINTTPNAPQVEIFYKVKTANSPADNSLIEFYFSRSDGTIRSGGLTGGDSASATVPKNELQFVHAQVTSGTSPDEYTGHFIVDNPGERWQLVVVNETGAFLSVTPSHHGVRYTYIVPEVQ